MSETFPASMHWLHTWTGVIIGALLFAIFWMGTLSVFDREIDRWMMPATRLAPAATVSLDAMAKTMTQTGAAEWGMQLPTDRTPIVSGYTVTDGTYAFLNLDPATGKPLHDPATRGATDFFFPFHYSLLIDQWQIGKWLIGLAAIAMMALCVSGVVIHRRIFADFFTLRIGRKTSRTTLDLHNVAGVLGLPFNFMIALSGLVFFIAVYVPGIQSVVYPAAGSSFTQDAFGGFDRDAAGEARALGSLDAMAREASRRWGGDTARIVRVTHSGDAAAYVSFDRSLARRVSMTSDAVIFDGPTGRLLHEHRTGPMMTTQRFISGMHFAQFRHWPLRWLYFASGLLGCVLIATGSLFWLQSRTKRHMNEGAVGMPLVRAITIGATTGMIAATLAYLIANRLLPADAAALGQSRAQLEIWAFFIVWIASFAHAALLPRRAWAVQCWAIAAGALTAVASNAVTTGDHPLHAALRGQWGVAGMDLVMLAGGSVAAIAAMRLWQRKPRLVAGDPAAPALPAA
ncbi:PepSY-associated TM helix domain-containing protein [Glacieibacterium frigidum]|uniref:PepSY domain-containing protein n=1 Tax=Glacieibacterium frigidum TaxID=2593303 RepID=A0A552UAC8_9SPHN|nr:PepSY-associated TM helix domain-containing protein [Glacieibacterium frigidum]TRW15171.1 PepSY domain-containing protein [Glacieibacterium frigidum]